MMKRSKKASDLSIVYYLKMFFIIRNFLNYVKWVHL